MLDTRKGYWLASDAKDIIGKMDEFNNGTQSWAYNPMWPVWSRNYFSYFSTVVRPQNWDTGLVFRGKQGELIEVLVPIAKDSVRQVVNLVTKQKILFKCLADSTAQNVLQTSRLGTSIAKQVVKNNLLDLKWSNSYEHELVTGMGFLYVKWRTDRGPIYGRDQLGKIHFKGDVEITVPTVYDVLFDPNIPDPAHWQWVQVREIHNRWDLIAQFPDLEDAIMALPCVRKAMSGSYSTTNFSASDEDYIYVYALYHTPSPALKNGRMVIYGDVNTVFADDDNFYGELPVYTSRGNPIPMCGYGDPLFSQLLASQEMLDTTVSAVCTNNAAFAVQNIIHPKGSGINVEQILGMNFFGYQPENIPGGGKPEPLQLTNSAPETYKLMEIMENYVMKLSGINAALRGTPPSQVSSGTAIATLTATALESINASAKSTKSMLQRAVNGAINCYRRFASVERPVEISGIGGHSKVQNFVGKDLDPVKLVELQEVNPLMQSLSGRVEMSKDMLSSGLITNQRAYFAVLEGAPPEEMYKNELSEEDLVNRENEEMLEGREVPTTSIDDHPYHILMHKMALNDPKIRRDQRISGIFLKHIFEHNRLQHETDPALMAMAKTGKAPDPALMQPPMPMLGPGQPNQMQPNQMQPLEEIKPRNNEPSDGESAAKPALPANDLLNRRA